MATIPVELNTILQTLVLPNYTNANVNNYYNPSDMSIVAPTTNPDRGMQIITETLLNLRNPASFGYNIALDATSKKELYKDASTDLKAAIDALTAVYTPIKAAYDALP